MTYSQSAMKAIVYTNYGQPEVLQLKEVEIPTPKNNEVLIKVHAATVNRTDCANLTAKPFIMRFMLGLFKPRKQILGTEFAGEIEAVGEEVSQFKRGDKVFGFDDGILSSYAEYLTLSEDGNFIIIPDGISFKKAAASSEGAHYAYNFINKVELKEGQKMMVNGGSGGIGSAMVQLAKHFGAEVTATCATKNMGLLKELGASKVIDYTKEDFTLDGEQYDYVFDSVGKSSFGKCKRLLKPGGVYISSELGKGSQNLFYSLHTLIFGHMPGKGKKKVLFPYPPGIKESLRLIRKLTDQGKFAPVIDREYPLEEIADAFKYVLKGQKTGNVIISINK